MSLLLLASQHPLGLSAGTFSCVYDFKWVIIRFNVGPDCYFTGMMFVNVRRGTSLQPISAQFSTSRNYFEMLHGSSRSKVRTIERRNIQSFPGKGGGCNSCACFTFTWIPGQPRTHQVEIGYLIAKTCFKMFVSVLDGEKKLRGQVGRKMQMQITLTWGWKSSNLQL